MGIDPDEWSESTLQLLQDIVVKCIHCQRQTIKNKDNKRFCSQKCANAYHASQRIEQLHHYNEIKTYLEIRGIWDNLCSDVSDWVNKGKPEDID